MVIKQHKYFDTSNNMSLLTDSSLPVSVFIVTVSILWQIWKFIKSHSKKPPLPPGPRGFPIVGYLPYLASNLHVQLAELAQKYGPIYKMWLGNKLCIVITSPSLIKEVVRDNDVIFANRDVSATALIGTYNANDISMSDYGPQWRMLRRLFLREMLSNNSLDGSYDLRRDAIRKEMRNVHSKIGIPLNMRELAFQINLNSILRMTWGRTYELDKGERTTTEFKALMSGFSEVLWKSNISDYFPILARFDIQGVGKEMKDLMKILDRILEDIIDTSSKMKAEEVEETIDKGRKDFVQMVVELKEKEDGKMPLTRTDMKALLANAILGATHTSIATIEWVMAELMRNPKEMEKVHKELNEVVGQNTTVEEFHISKLKYLSAVLKEALRLHPVGPFLMPRRPSQTCIVGGYTIPKDSAIFLSLWALHRDPLAWENPSEFKPERFLGKNENIDFDGNSFNYIPFGSGRRICAGLPLADRVLRFILASLLHSFEWKLPQGKILNMEDKFGGILMKKDPLFVVPIPRLSDSMYV